MIWRVIEAGTDVAIAGAIVFIAYELYTERRGKR